MKLHSLLGIAAIFLILAGCSSTPTRVDKGPIHAKTFNFVVRPAQAAPDFADDRAPVHALIQAAITQHLAGLGVRQVAAGGDVTAGYLVIIGNNASTEAINTYFGYGEAASALHDKAHEAYIKSKNPNYLESGTLLIDIVDTKSGKLLKRGYATRQVIRDISAEARAERIQQVVDEILQNLKVD